MNIGYKSARDLKVTPDTMQKYRSISQFKCHNSRSKQSFQLLEQKMLLKRNEKLRHFNRVILIQSAIASYNFESLSKLESTLWDLLSNSTDNFMFESLISMESLLSQSLKEIIKRIKVPRQTKHLSDGLKDIKAKESNKPLIIKQKAWDIEKCSLQTKISELEKRLKDYASSDHSTLMTEQIQKLEHEKTELNKNVKALKDHKSNTKVRLFKLQFKIGKLKDAIEDRDKYIKELETSLLDERHKSQDFEYKCEKLSNTLSKTREHLLMLSEDFSVILHQKKYVEDLFYKSRFPFIKHLVDFSDDFYIQSGFTFQIPMKTELERFLVTNSEGNLDEEREVPPVIPLTECLKELKYKYPSLKDFLSTRPEKSEFVPPFKNWVQVYIRAIYRSKFNEHIHQPRPSSLMSFVYDWLNTFYIEERTFKVKHRIEPDSDFLRNFILYLTIAPSSYLEIHMFRQFIEGNFKIDELDFFLKAQHMICDEVNNNSIVYVSIDQVFLVISNLMHGFPTEEIKKIKSFLFEKKTEEFTIDFSLALRVLLEYYRYEKTIKFKVIQDIFMQSEKVLVNNAYSVSFDRFEQICHCIWTDFPDVAGTYRKCWRYGNGVITAEVFFTVINESGHFLKMLLLRKGRKTPSQQVMAKWKQEADDRDNDLKIIEQIGIPEFVKQFERYEDVFAKRTHPGLWSLTVLYEQYHEFISAARNLLARTIKHK